MLSKQTCTYTGIAIWGSHPPPCQRAHKAPSSLSQVQATGFPPVSGYQLHTKYSMYSVHVQDISTILLPKDCFQSLFPCCVRREGKEGPETPIFTSQGRRLRGGQENSSSMGMAGAALTPQPGLPASSCIGLVSMAGAQHSMTVPLHPLRQR